VWNTDSSGNWSSSPITNVSGSSTALKSIETSFQQDLNGDGMIGVAAAVIESAGSTKLVQVGSNFYFNPVAGGTGPSLKYGGVDYVDAQPWAAIGVEQIAGGYEVAWHNTATNVYTVWNTDSSGNWSSSPITNVSGSSTALKSIETSFQQDLNGDGVIGVAATVIESAGSTKLVQVGSNFYFNPVAGGTGPSLKYGGVDYVDAQPWAAIGVEQIAGGYEVAWYNTATNVYTVWNTDSSGNWSSSPIANVSGSSTALKSIETSFQQDLNGDGMLSNAWLGNEPVDGFVSADGNGHGTDLGVLVLNNGAVGALRNQALPIHDFSEADMRAIDLHAGFHFVL
jgi:20S proteasome alpha/beta subunit